MNSIHAITLVAFVLLASAAPVEAQQTARPKRIGVVWSGAISPVPLVTALREGLREHGWSEGKNVVIELRFADNPDRLAEMVAELVRLPVDVFVTGTVPATLLLKKATQTIPIVTNATDPAGTGLVTRGGNVAAFDVIPADAAGRQIEMLREVVPGLSGLAIVLTTRSNPAGQLNAQRAREAAEAAGLHVLPIDAQDAGELDVALAGLRNKSIQAIFVVPDPRFSQDKRFRELITATGLPTICQERQYAETGCVIAYGISVPNAWRQSASYVDRILKGTPPADLPIGRPRFELAINAGSAKTIGLTIPPSVLKRADAVIP